MTRMMLMSLGADIGDGHSIALDARLELDATEDGVYPIIEKGERGHTGFIVGELSNVQVRGGAIWGSVTFYRWCGGADAFDTPTLEWDRLEWDDSGLVLTVGRLRGATAVRR